jgi:pyrimidine-nucleoside phosphorylase
MRAVDIIRKKRDGEELSRAEIDEFVRGATTRRWPAYQVSALLMAIVLRGMSPAETADLTAAMIHSGEKLDLGDLPGPKIDKHSTGGVGDKVSLILAPLAAACGVVVPMMSGRGLGHSGGTLDKLEAIPGFRVGLSLEEFRAALKKVGCAMIGQTSEIAPADRVLYALRDVTATVESIPLITASIMSKKIAEGIEGLVLDVKRGKGAFMKKREDARRLAESLVAIGQAHGVRTEAVLTAMDEPLGSCVGNALEVEESIQVLMDHGPRDITSLSVHLAARMVHLAGLAGTLEEAEKQVRNALTSGRGLQKLREIIAQQGGNPEVMERFELLPQAPREHYVYAKVSGYVTDIDAEKIGRAAMLLGAGRNKVRDRIDPSAGIVLHVKCGEQVSPSYVLCELRFNKKTKLAEAIALVEEACVIGDAPPPPRPLVLETLEHADHGQ